jgi:hypothetical protein
MSISLDTIAEDRRCAKPLQGDYRLGVMGMMRFRYRSTVVSFTSEIVESFFHSGCVVYDPDSRDRAHMS